MNVATLPSYKEFFASTIDRVSQTMVNDLRHIPQDKLNVTPMGCARPPLEFVAECAGYNHFIASVLRGQPMEVPDEEGRQRYYATINTFDKARSALEGSVKDLQEALAAANEEDLAQMVTAPWGETLPLYLLLYIAASHMSYHDGQLNYIQCLYGDGKNHWAGE